jgi:hypothetical protein
MVVDLSVVFLVDLTRICEDGMVGNILTLSERTLFGFDIAETNAEQPLASWGLAASTSYKNRLMIGIFRG